RELPGFLRSWSGEGARADLPDLATLEWARAKVFEERNVEPAPAELLRSVAADELPRLRLRFVPALRVLELGHDLGDLWETLEARVPPSPTLQHEQSVAIWRKSFEWLLARTDPNQARAAWRARPGARLSG